MKFKAAILTEINKPLIIDEVESTELKVGQVLVKVLMSGLCGAQLQEIAGLKGNAKFLPHLLGHEGCGIVQQIGLGVKNVKIGDKVVMHWRVGEGIESDFPRYIYNNKLISSGKVTTISKYSIVSENRLTVVGEYTSPELCCLLGCGLTTALGTINNEANVKFGESVLILGAGGVGLNLIQAAKLANALPISVVEINENKRKLAFDLGATYYYKNIFDVRFTTNTFDVIIDTTGNQDTINNAISLLSDNGRIILVAQHKSSITIEQPNLLFSGEGQSIKATQGGKTQPNKDIPRYEKMYQAGILKIQEVITDYYLLDDINDAINKLKSGDAGRIMINME